MQESVYDFFNLTENYLHRSFGVRIRAEIVGNLVKPLNKKILDAGCGDGGVSLQFLPQNHILFLDISENMLELVRRSIPSEHAEKATIIQSSLTDFNPPNKFDYIFGIGLLAHVPSVSKTLKRMSSLLNSDGLVIIQFSNYDSWLTKLRVKFLGNQSYNVNQLRSKELGELVRHIGFQIQQEVRFSFLLPGMGRLPDGLLYHYSKFIWKNKIGSRLGTDFIWVLKKNEE